MTAVAHAAVAALLAASPVRSWDTLPFGNGFGIAAVDAGDGELTDLRNHVYAERAPGEFTVEIGRRGCFGVAVDLGPGVWLCDVPANEVDYLDGTGVVQARHQVGPFLLLTSWFSPWTLERPSVVQVLQVVNVDPVHAHSVMMAALMDHHLGKGSPYPFHLNERIQLVAPSTWVEGSTETDHRMVYRAAPTANQWSATPSDPYEAFLVYGSLPGISGDVDAAIVTHDAIAGFARGDLDLDPGESTWFSVVTAYGTAAEEKALPGLVDAWLEGRTPEELLADELASWDAWAAADLWATEGLPFFPGGAIVPDEEAVWKQGLAVLRMSQVREPSAGAARPHGQIVRASHPAIFENRTWPRDAAYAVAALARTGFTQEAWDALRFVLRGKAGAVPDVVGADYLVSVARYYGHGAEETHEADAGGPNVELDNFGLFLWALGEWADRQEALGLLEIYWPDVEVRVADVLAALLDAEDGLLPPDSSIWEAGLAGQKRFTYSNIAAVAGLCAAWRIGLRIGDPAKAWYYKARAEALRDVIVTEMIDPSKGSLAGNLEEIPKGEAIDASVVEAVNWGLVPPNSPLADTTLAWLETLRIAGDRGFSRSDDPEPLAQYESVFVDLRMASAFALTGRQYAAEVVLGWVTDQARQNFDLLPEFFSREAALYFGAVPTTGYGAAVYGLARFEDQPVLDEEGCIAWSEEDAFPVDPRAPGGSVEPRTPPEPDVAPAGTPEPEAAEDPEPAAPAPLDAPEPTGKPSNAGDGCAAGAPAPLALAALFLLAIRARARQRLLPRR